MKNLHIGLVEAAALFVEFAALFLILVGLGRFLGVTNLGPPALIAIVAALALARRAGSAGRSARYLGLGLLTLLVPIAGLAAAAVHDLSWDGLAYHMVAARMLMDGWNPALDPAPRLNWAAAYPNGWWTLQAGLSRLVGTIEGGKGLTMVAAAPSLILGLAVARQGSGNGERLRGATVVLMVLSPIFGCQFLSGYNDAGLYELGLTLIFGLWLAGTPLERVGWRVALASVVPLATVKLSGVYYAATLGILGVAMAPWDWKLRTRRLARLAVAGLVAVLVVGWRPYVTTPLERGVAIWPDPRAIVAENAPRNLLETDRASGLIYAVAARSDDPGPDRDARLKWPWAPSIHEWAAMAYPGIRAGGFGPLFAAGLAMSLLSLILAWRKGARLDRRWIALALALVAISAPLPGNWWARYVPFLWTAALAPLLVATPAPWRLAWAARVIALVLFASGSGAAILLGAAREVGESDELDRRFERFAQAGGRVVIQRLDPLWAVKNRSDDSWARRLERAGLTVAVTDRADACPEGSFQSANVRLCASGEAHGN